MRRTFFFCAILFLLIALSTPLRFAYAAAPQSDPLATIAGAVQSITQALTPPPLPTTPSQPIVDVRQVPTEKGGVQFADEISAAARDVTNAAIAAVHSAGYAITHALSETASAWSAWVSLANADLTSKAKVASIPATAAIIVSQTGANAPPTTATSSSVFATAHLSTAGTSSGQSISTNDTLSQNVKRGEIKTAGTATDYVTRDDLTAALAQATNALRSLIYQNESVPGSLPSSGGVANNIALSNRIDQLTGTKLNNITVNGVFGLTASDIPTNVVASNYLPLAGGTLIGPFANSSTASSSFAGALGVGTTSPTDMLSVNGPIFLSNVMPAATTNRLYSNAGGLYWAGSLIGGGSVGNWSTDGTNVWRAGGNVGIGTTSPAATLGVAGGGYFTGALNFGASGNAVLNSQLGSQGQYDIYTFGHNALNSLIYDPSTSCCSIAFGYNSLADATTTDHETMYGEHSGEAIQYASAHNTGLGIDIFRFFDPGTWNTVVGEQAEDHGDGGHGNLNFAAIFGANAGNWAVGSGNSAFGYNALFSSSTNQLTGSGNAAFGKNALSSIAGAATNNTAVGADALILLTTATNNTAVGNASGDKITTGSQNSLFGYQSGFNDTTGGANTDFGYQAGFGLTTGAFNTIVGFQVGKNTLSTGSNNILIGTSSSTDVPTPNTSNYLNIGNTIYSTMNNGLVGIGTTTPFATLSIAGSPGAIQNLLAISTSTSTFATSTAIRVSQNGNLHFLNGAGIDIGTGNSPGGNNLFVQGTASTTNLVISSLGASAGQCLTTNSSGAVVNELCSAGPVTYWTSSGSVLYNNVGTLIGINNTSPSYALDVAGDANVSGGNFYRINGQGILYASSTLSNLDLGFSAGAATTTTGANNVIVGQSAGQLLTSGTQNVYVGNLAGRTVTTQSSNTAIGHSALNGHTSGQNTAVGAFSLQASGSGGLNTALGFEAGFSDTSGANNIFLGWEAASTTASGSKNIALGYDIALPSTNGSNQLDIGNLIFGTGINGEGTNLSTGNIGIGTTTPWRTLSVTGTVGLDGLGAITGTNSSLCLDSNKQVVFSSNSDSCASSLRSTKHDIAALTLMGTTTLAQLVPVSFVYNNDASSTVRYGFIAEDAAAVDSHFGTYDQNGNLSGIDDRSFIAVLVKAVQELITEVDNLETTISGFAQSFVSDNITVNNELCIKKSDGMPVCITGDQLAALLAGNGGGANQSPSAPQPNPEAGTNPPVSVTSTSTPPVITIAGDNPAVIHIGDTYNDLGATITAPDADKNLGIKIFLNGALVSNIVLDTAHVATDTIDYIVTDTNGVTATSTRTVIVQAANSAAATTTPQ